MKTARLTETSKKLIGEIIDNYEADAINLPSEMYNELKYHLKQLNKYASQRDTEPKEESELLNFILETDFLTTSEFCKKYNIPEPVFTGEVQSSARQFLQIDVIKHKMYVEKAKEIVRRKPVSEPVKSEGKGAEEILAKYLIFDRKEDLWVGEVLRAMKEYASLPAKSVTDEDIYTEATRRYGKQPKVIEANRKISFIQGANYFKSQIKG